MTRPAQALHQWGIEDVPCALSDLDGLAHSVASVVQPDRKPLYTLTVAPGAVALRKIPPDPADRDLRRLVRRATAERHRGWGADARPERSAESRAPKGVDTSLPTVGWSSRSRSTFVRKMAQLDLSPWEQDPDALRMLTLTYPPGWTKWAPDFATSKKQLKTFLMRMERAVGRELPLVWKLEFTRKWFPHYHLMLQAPYRTKGGRPFADWAKQAWYEIVGSGVPGHREAGAWINRDRRDRRGLPAAMRLVYFAAETGAGGDKEYQQITPPNWIERGGAGRFWGAWHLKPATRQVDLDATTAMAAYRVMRDYWRAAHGPPADPEQPYPFMANPDRGHLMGGFVVSSDPAALVDRIVAQAAGETKLARPPVVGSSTPRIHSELADVPGGLVRSLGDFLAISDPPSEATATDRRDRTGRRPQPQPVGREPEPETSHLDASHGPPERLEEAG